MGRHREAGAAWSAGGGSEGRPDESASGSSNGRQTPVAPTARNALGSSGEPESEKCEPANWANSTADHENPPASVSRPSGPAAATDAVQSCCVSADGAPADHANTTADSATAKRHAGRVAIAQHNKRPSHNSPEIIRLL